MESQPQNPEIRNNPENSPIAGQVFGFTMVYQGISV